jgi:hypothetical protein
MLLRPARGVNSDAPFMLHLAANHIESLDHFKNGRVARVY